MSTEEIVDNIHEMIDNPTPENEQKMIDLILPLTDEQKLDVIKQYESKYQKVGLEEDIDQAFGNTRFANTLSLLFKPRVDFCCAEIHKRLYYYISDEDVIFEILIGTPKWLRDFIKERYEKIYGNKLEEDIDLAYRGDVKRNILTLLNVERNVNMVPDKEECEKCAEKLKKTPPAGWAANADIFTEIFAKKSPEELLLIGRIFREMTGKSPLEVVNSSIKGRNQILLRELLYGVINPSELMARKLRQEIKGLGVNANNLDRLMVSRYDVDMAIIRRFYLQLYGEKISEDLIDATVGDYNALLTGLTEEMSGEKGQELLDDYHSRYPQEMEEQGEEL